MDDRSAWLLLSLVGAPASRAAHDALVRGLSPGEMAARGVPKRVVRAIASDRRTERDIALLAEESDELGLIVLTPDDEGWPSERFAALDDRGDAPAALYTRGHVPVVGRRAVALVGTRAATPYGHDLARSWAADFAAAGIDVISGLALGVDGAAHRGALDGGGTTRAIVAGGLEAIYPPEHRALADAIAERGTLIAEVPPGVRPERWRFARRNRIVAALAHAVIVVEAPRRSGARITAGSAHDQGREVFAIPGSVHWDASAGCLAMLHAGEAAVARTPGDVLERLGWGTSAPRSGVHASVASLPDFADPREERLFRVLDATDGAVEDDLARRTGLAPHEVAALLSRWEIEGHVVRTPGVGVRHRRAR